jgi:hypothetical protein
MAPPLLKHRMSSLLKKSSESDRSPPSRALVLPNKPSRDSHIPQPKASSDQNVLEHKNATFEVTKWFMKAIVFTLTPWQILSDVKYAMVEEAWELAIEPLDCQRELEGPPVGTPTLFQLPGTPPPKIDPQTREPVSLEFSQMLLYQAYGY